MPAARNIVSRATAALASSAVLVNNTRSEPFQPAAFACATSDLAFSRSYAGPGTAGSHGKLFWNNSEPVRPVPWYTRSFQVFASNAAAIAWRIVAFVVVGVDATGPSGFPAHNAPGAPPLHWTIAPMLRSMVSPACSMTDSPVTLSFFACATALDVRKYAP